MGNPVRAAVVIAATLLLATAAWAVPPAAHYLCYRAKPARTPATRGLLRSKPDVVAIDDRFLTSQTTVRRLDIVCQAARTLEGGPVASDEGFAVHEAGPVRRRPRHPRRIGQTAEVQNRFGRVRVTLERLDRLALPAVVGSTSAANPAPTAPFACYAVTAARAKGQPRRVALVDALGERLFALGRPRRLCVADDEREMLCYRARLARTRPLRQTAPAPRLVAATTAAGSATLRARDVVELCVRSMRSVFPGEPPAPPGETPTDPPPPTTTTTTTLPTPAFRLRLTPSAVTLIAGQRPGLTATADFDAGHSEELSDRVVWRSSDEAVAFIKDSAGGSFVATRGPGTATISAFDPMTGIASSDTGDDATLTVTWPLEKLTMEPHAVTRKPGDHESFTVTAHFTGGYRRNVTQLMQYESSASWLVRAPNTTGQRSRVEALHPSVATISTTDSGNDGTVRVRAGIRHVSIRGPGEYWEMTLLPGEAVNLTAKGSFGDGSSVSLTQTCQWTSSDPAVVATPNAPPNRGRILAVGLGSAKVSCLDATTLETLASIYADVVGNVAAIEAHGGVDPLGIGHPTSLTALAVHEPYAATCCRGRRNITQDVMWTSRDPEVAVMPNTPGRRSEVVAVGVGTARIFATDPVTGFTSNDVTVRSTGAFQGIDIRFRWNWRGILGVGARAGFDAVALHEGGRLRLEDDEYVLESSDPSVARVTPDGHSIRGVRAGYTTIAARHVATGSVSPGYPLTVKGQLERILLEPTAIRRGIGETENLTALGVIPPEFTVLMTQDVVYVSSDPSVVVATNQPGNRSLLRTVGAGTAVITATDPVTGIAADEGVTVTVLPGTIERITIEPPTAAVPWSPRVRALDPWDPNGSFAFTAIGHYPNGDTINVTQQVTWTSLHGAVGIAPNTPSDRSRIHAVGLGTATITARHPSGVSSHDTGDDGSLLTTGLTSIAIAPATLYGSVGETVRFTLTGQLADGSVVNLTREGRLSTADWNVARPRYGVDDDRSALDLFQPGTAQIFASWGGYVVTATVVVTP